MRSDNYKILINKLDAFIRKYYKNRLLKGCIYSLGLLLIAFIVFTSVEYFAQFNITGRTILFYTFLAIAAYVLASFIIIPLSKLYRLGKLINHQQAAAIIGNHFEEVKDKLINVLQLEQLAQVQNNHLLLASIDQKSLELNPVPFTNAVNLKENKKYIKYLIIPLLLFLLLAILSPNIFTEGTNRLIHHSTYIQPVAPFQMHLKNTRLTVLKNQDYSLQVNIKGKQLPNKVYLEREGNKYLLSKDNQLYNYTFKNVQKNQPFKLYAAGFYSEAYELKVIPNPILSHFSVNINYPNYLTKPSETLNNIGDLILPEGSKIQWNIETEDAATVNFMINDSAYQLTPTNDRVNFSKMVKQSQSYAIVPSNRFVVGSDTMQYTLQVIKDEFPSITAAEKRDSLNSNHIYFKGEIKDDYGFTGLKFNYKILTLIDSLPNRNELTSIKIPFNKIANVDEFFHFWNVEELNMLPGDELSYYFEVWDNDGVNGRKSATTALKIFKSKTISERDVITKKNNKDIKKGLSESVEEAIQLQKELATFRKKLAEKQKLEWEEKQQLKQLLAKQKELEKKVNEVQQQNEQNNEQQNNYKQLNEDILEKQDQLQKLFDELITDEMKEMMKKLEEMMEKLDKNKLEQELEKMDLSNKDIEKELDRSLELFKQLEFEQKLDEVKNQLDKLAEKQNELSEDTKNKKATQERLKKEQEELNKSFEQLREDLKELHDMDKNLEKPNGFEDTQQQEEQIEQEMEKSANQIENKKNKKAAEAQQKATKKMKEMSKQIAAMQAQMADTGEDMDALRQLLDNLLHLSFEQEDLMKKYEKVDRQNPEYVTMTQQQKKLKDDAKMIADSLFALSKRVVQLASKVNKEIGLINDNMDKAIDLMAERLNPMAVARQQYIMTSINNLALLFDESLQQMQQQMQQKPGNGSCNKPGTGQPKPGMGAIKKMQQQLSNQLKEMEKALQQGKKPGQKGKGGLPKKNGMSESLAKMAAQQAKIRSELQKLRNEGTKGTGNLSKLMEENERDIVNKRINRQTINRQKEILTRLLESEKADLEREWDNKRESKEGKKTEKSNFGLFFEYNSTKEKEVDLIKTTPPNLNSFYKRKVNEYFQNKYQ